MNPLKLISEGALGGFGFMIGTALFSVVFYFVLTALHFALPIGLLLLPLLLPRVVKTVREMRQAREAGRAARAKRLN